MTKNMYIETEYSPTAKDIPMECLSIKYLTQMEQDKLLLSRDESQKKGLMKIGLSRGERRKKKIKKALVEGEGSYPKKKRDKPNLEKVAI